MDHPYTFRHGECPKPGDILTSYHYNSVPHSQSHLIKLTQFIMKPFMSCIRYDGTTCSPLNSVCLSKRRQIKGTQKDKPLLIYRNHMESIFKELEHKVISLVKKELKWFKKLLSPDYPACSEREMEDQSSVREGALKITLHVLRNMNQIDLANTLQTKVVSIYQQKLKHKLMEKYQRINEGLSQHGSSTLLNKIYTELYITEGGSGELNNEHEVRQIETASRRPATQETSIKCNDLFKDKPIRRVLTKGVAGIGKTISVQKFILDWAEGRANQDVVFIFPLPFRELNLIKEKRFSLMDLLCYFFPEINQLQLIDCDVYKVIFIFDGLDECRLPLDFQNNENLWEVTRSSSVDVLLTNLIKGNLLPSALLWITSRPAAANQIPPECVFQITEVRGFSALQKEEYFRKRIIDQSLANRIITHMKSSRSLYIMCHIPVFCWIAATVLERMLGEAESGEIPKTLTRILERVLGKLAFQQLEKGNLIFYEEDLKECGIDVKEASVYSGVCTQIFREESGLHLGKVFSFVHLSVQEFLAALYTFLSFISNNTNVLEEQTITVLHDFKRLTMSDFLINAVDKALQSENGHLDLFLRFLLGLSLESNQTLLRGLLTQTGSSSHSTEETVNYIKEKIRKNPSPEKSINLFHCLKELNDHSLVQEVQTYLSRRGYCTLSQASRCLHGSRLSPAQWSALVFVLLNSEEELDEFDLSKYDRSEECLLRLLPVVTASRKAVLDNCSITDKGCAALASALRSNPSSHLRELNLNYNKPGDSGVKQLSALLEDPHCNLEKLHLVNCGITDEGCAALASALRSNPSSHLRELNLNYNKPGDSGVKQLSALLEDPHCQLEILQLYNCSITEEGCAALASALRSNPSSHLRELNLNLNEPGDSGVKLLSALLEDLHCKLEKLELSDCSITDKGCAALASALSSNPSSHLRELNLNLNKPGDSGVKQLSALLEDPHCKLEKLQLYNCSITEEGCAALASALRSNPSSHLRELNLNLNKPGNSGVKQLSALLEDPHCTLEKLHSAFNTIIPSLLTTKLEDLGLHTSLCDWISNFLTDRPQSVRVGNCASSTLTLSTGAPQGCVLSPLLYSLYTYDCTATSSSTIIVKFADDTVVMGLISDNDERAYLEQIKHLENWCQENNLLLNVSKTKELIMDCSKKQERHYQTVRISGTMVERVDSFRYLGVHISQDLSWSRHTNFLAKKARQCLYHLRRLRDFRLPSKVLRNFYTCTIESILAGNITVWFGNSTKQDRQALQRVVRSAEHITHTELPDLQTIYHMRCQTKARRIVKDPTDPNNRLFSLLRTQHPAKPYQPNFQSGNVGHEYYSLILATGKQIKDQAPSIN
ncbi:hypothetical protein P4O66_004107 [Electrophorus voltai]|uniref:NACHT domain-containing protein n=1 Tax=Electrophorus voltai TaxID=2609070 RepID=A0AAD8ZQG8_9TELE|nr:hypothetical protein P4O66_004107 [Electrophorus voltai]